MENILASLLVHVNVLREATEQPVGSRPRIGKTERLRAVNDVKNAVGKKSTITALTAASTLEMVRGPEEDTRGAQQPLGWAELAVVLVETLVQTCAEALNSRSTSKSGTCNLKLDYMACFRAVLKLSMANGPEGVIRPIVPAFLFFASSWLSEPPLRALLADDIWQCVRDLVHDEANRGMLTSPYIDGWASICVEQLTGRGPLHHSSPVATKLAAEVLETIPQGVFSCDTLTQSTKGLAPSKMAGGDYGYAIVCKHCCNILVISQSLPSTRAAKELQCVAFRTLTTTLSDHALDVVGSNALKSVINLSLKPILSCWKDRRHHDAAVALASVLLRLDPNHKRLSDACRQRLLTDMRDESSAVVRAGEQVKEQLIDAAAACVTFRESLQFAASSDAGQGRVVVWLRVAHAIISRRVLKPRTSLHIDIADLMDQCTTAAEAIASVFRTQKSSRRSLYSEISRWSARVIDCTAAIANKIHCEVAPASAVAVEAWQKLFFILREQMGKLSYSARRKGTHFDRNGEAMHGETPLLQTASLLTSLAIFDASVMSQTLRQDEFQRTAPYPLSKIASGQDNVSPMEVGYLRNMIARCGIQEKDGGHTRLLVVGSLVGICDRPYRSIRDAAMMLVDGSCAAVGLTRGECTVRPWHSHPNPFQHFNISSDSYFHSFNYFQVYFGCSAGQDKISTDGRILVEQLKNEKLIFDNGPENEQPTTGFSVLRHGFCAQTESTTPSSSRNSVRFAVDAVTTLATESQMLEKLRDFVDRYDLISMNSRHSREGSSSASDIEPSQKRSRCRGFPNAGSCAVGVRIIIFIGNYLLEGISCGCISLHEGYSGSGWDALERLAKLLGDLLCSFAASDISFLVPVLGLLDGLVQICGRLRTALNRNHSAGHTTISGDAQTSHSFLKLSEVLDLSLDSVAKNLCTWLMRTISARKKESISKVQKHLAGYLFSNESHQQRLAKRRKPASNLRKERKTKRRRVSPAFGSDDSGGSPRSRSNRVQKSNGFDDDREESEGDSDASLSDDFGDEMLRTPTRRTNNGQASGQDASSLKNIQDATSVLCWLLNEMPDSSDGVLDICLKCIEADEEAERVLSPDGFERSALASSLVESCFMDLRECLWSVLFSLDSGQALEAVARDLTKTGGHWKDLERVSHSYDSFYVDSLKIRNNNRKTFPMSKSVERLRISFLDHARLFIEKCLVRGKSSTSTRRGLILSSMQTVTSLVSALVDISEHFRTKHAFRMPRATRIAYMNFGIAAIQIANENCGGASGSEGDSLQTSSLREAVKAIQTALRKFMADSEAIVRLAAARAVPSLLLLSSRQPVPELEVDLQDSIPQILSCQETDVFFGSAVVGIHLEEISDGNAGLQLELSDDERIACLTVSESFRTVGSQAKACTSFLVFAEVGGCREELIPFSVVQILLRIIKGSGCRGVAYHVLARICVARGYCSPGRFYQTFARLIVPRWFKDSQDFDMLYKLPSSLLVDTEHDSETALYDWMRDQQPNLVPEILVRDEAPSFRHTEKFAEVLGLSLETLLLSNVGPFSLVFPMQFIRYLHERGKKLWEGIDTVLGGRSQELMFKHKSDVMRYFLRNVSCGWYGQENFERGSLPDIDLGFCRDTSDVHPPFYDPLVIACAMNQLFESESNVYILPKSVLCGSLFSEVRDEQTGAVIAEKFGGFVAECQRGKISLLRTLLAVSRSIMGPPVPQPAQNRLDGFFCVGMLWRMLGVNVLVKSPVERVMFYRLLARGFEQNETMNDAAWLLAEVQTKVIRMEECFPDVRTDFSGLSMNPVHREHLLCLSTSQERQMYELLSAVSPGLMSVISGDVTAFSSSLQQNAANALRDLLELCHDKALWTVIMCNGPLPQLEQLAHARHLYESSKSMIEVDETTNDGTRLISSIERFQGIFQLRNSSQSLPTLLACLQEISSLLTDSAVSDLSDQIRQEAWLRSDGRVQPTVSRITDAISCLINLIHETNAKLKRRSGNTNAIEAHSSHQSERTAVQLHYNLSQEVGHVMSVVGLLHPQSALYVGGDNQKVPIPSLPEAGRYEDVESGIERCLFSLVELLRGPSSIAAETSLSTLLELLGSEDGKKVFLKEKERLLIIHPIRSAARKLSTSGLRSAISVTLDPYTGQDVMTDNFPKLLDASLWSVQIDEQSEIPHEYWMRRLCFILSSNCTSGALRTMAPACYISYEISRGLVPYLLMNIVAANDPHILSELSKLISKQILLNPAIPDQILSIFVHALDVLCQIGSDIIYRDGVSRWVFKDNNQVTLKHRYVLDISYAEAARAALRSRSYFSAVRFAQMHVDHISTNTEFQGIGRTRKAGRRQILGPARDLACEMAESDAKSDITDIVREAMVRINERDGVRAFGYAENLPKSVANLAILDRDWTKSISALDMLGRRVEEPHVQESKSNTYIQHGNIRRELLLMKTFIGLGTLSIATDYWDGLRTRMMRVGVSLKTSGMHSETPTAELNDLRYALAWKLGQWESPPLLPNVKRPRVDTQEVYGFHESIYRVLQAFRLQRWGEVSELLSQARRMELQNLVIENVGASSVSIFQSSARLRLYQILEDVQAQNRTSRNSGNTRTSNIATGEKGASFTQCRGGPIHHSQMDRDFASDYRNSHSKALDGSAIDRILDGYLGLHDGRGPGKMCMNVDPFDESILAEDLPVAIAHSIGRGDDIVRAAAAVSMRVLAKGGKGCWARAASCLEDIPPAMVRGASQVNRVAWKLQGARLQWSATQDASSKKQALETVRGIICRELGGAAVEKRTPSSGSSNRSIWVDIADKRDSEQYAYLRSEACIIASEWSLDMRTSEPIALFNTFLEAGLGAVEAVRARTLTGRMHFAMATFADAQINSIDSYRKTRKYDQMVSAVRDAEEQIDKLQTIKNERKQSSRGSARRGSRSRLSQLSGGISDKVGKDLDSFIREERKKTSQERTRLERMQAAYQKWQVLACAHFAACLRDGSVHDLRAAFRMVAIWLDAGQMRETITESLLLEESSDGNLSQRISLPSVKLLPLAPQLCSRLSSTSEIGSGLFRKTLADIISEMAERYPAYCLWQLLALSNSTRTGGTEEKYASLYRGNKDKKDAADAIMNSLQAKMGRKLDQMRSVADAFIKLSETPKQKNATSMDIRTSSLVRLGELHHVTVPTVPLPLDGSMHSSKLPYIKSFETRAGICSGLSKPLRVVCIGSDGKPYPQMVKGRDDLRGDAVMEQLFTILNSLLEKDEEASKRSLLVRTYRIIPLSPFSGIMQFVSNTTQLKDVLVEQDKSGSSRSARKSLHERYRPSDMKHEEFQNKTFPLRASHEVPQRLKVLRQIWHRIQPVFHFFFLEQWPDPTQWFSHQLAYSRSVAVMSMVGFILGLGDRHLSNILLDVVTGEVVHIDFGIAFEQGKLLPTPEKMPFRLTRDIVDGFGIAGVEGIFRRCSEVTLSVMRRNKDVLLTVVEVLLHDPMFNWDLAPEVVIREQLSLGVKDGDMFDSDGLSKLDDSAADAIVRNVNKNIRGNTDAKRALNRISEKLDGLEGTERLSIEAHVARLIDEAQAFHVIASVYPGWSPWL